MTTAKPRKRKKVRACISKGEWAVYKTGEVARFLGVSAKTASTVLDQHGDLSYRVLKDRRISRENFFVMVDRLGLTPQQLTNMPAGLVAWLGTPAGAYRELSDVVGLTLVSATDAIRTGRLGGLLCFRSEMTDGELMFVANMVSGAAGRAAVALNDDQLAYRRKTPEVWLFDPAETPLAEAARWVRRMGAV